MIEKNFKYREIPRSSQGLNLGLQKIVVFSIVKSIVNNVLDFVVRRYFRQRMEMNFEK